MKPNDAGSVVRRPNKKLAPSRLKASKRSTASLPSKNRRLAGVRSTISANTTSISRPPPTVRNLTKRRRSGGQSANASPIMTSMPNALTARSPIDYRLVVLFAQQFGQRVCDLAEARDAVHVVDQEIAVVGDRQILHLECADAISRHERRIFHALHRQLLRRVGHVLGLGLHDRVVVAAA